MTDTRAIQVGDLVQVVAPTPCCGNDNRLGETFIFSGARMDVAWCAICGTQVITDYTKRPYGVMQINRLKRIPPLEELERTTTDEPMKEPA